VTVLVFKVLACLDFQGLNHGFFETVGFSVFLLDWIAL
jgi:hypothetical protein